MIDPTLALMKAYKAPLTRENYLNWAFNGNPPSTLDAEEEMQLPPQFRLPVENDAPKALPKPMAAEQPLAHPTKQPAAVWAESVKGLAKK